jgi:hypothetical protein
MAASHALLQNVSAGRVILRWVATGAVRHPGMGKPCPAPERCTELAADKPEEEKEEKEKDAKQTASRL